MEFFNPQTGEAVTADPAQVEADVRAGRLAVPTDAPIAITKPGSPKVFQATADNLADWLQKGYRLAGDEQVAAYDAAKAKAKADEEYRNDPVLSALSPIAGFAAGASAAPLWLPSVVGAIGGEEEKAGVIEGLRRLEERPGYKAGEIASYLAPLGAATKGTGALARLARGASEMAVVPRAIAGLGTAASGFVEGALPTAAGRLGRAAIGAAETVTALQAENAAIAAIDATKDAALSDRDFTAEQWGEAFTHHALPGALWGGALAAVAGGAMGAFAKTAKVMGEAEVAAAEKGAFTRWAERAREHEVMRATGGTPTDFRAWITSEGRVPGLEERIRSMVLHDIPEEAGVGAIGRTRLLPSQMEPHLQTLKTRAGEEISAVTKRVDELADETGIRFDLDSVRKTVLDRVRRLEEIPGGRPIAKQMQAKLTEWEETIGSSAATAAKRAALEDELVAAQGKLQHMQEMSETSVGMMRAEVEAVKKAARDEAYAMADAAVPHGAKDPYFNGASPEYLEGLRRRFTAASAEAEEAVFAREGEKIARLEDRMYRTFAKEQAAVRAQAKDVSRLERELADVREPSPKFADVHAGRVLFDKTINWSDQGSKALNDELKAMRTAIESEFMAKMDAAAVEAGEDVAKQYAKAKLDYAAASVLERAIKHGAVKEASVGLISKSDVGIGALSFAANPISAVPNALIWSQYRRHGAMLNATLLDAFLTSRTARAAGKTVKETIDEAAQAAVRGEKVAVEAGEAVPDFATAAARVREAASEGPAFGRRLAGAKDALDEAHPDVGMAMQAAAIRAVAYLNSLLPPRTPREERAVVASRPEVDTSTQVAFLNAAKAVQAPAAALARAANGEASLAEMDAVRSVYPGMYAYFREQTLRAIRGAQAAGKPIPYDQMLIIEMLLQEPLLPGHDVAGVGHYQVMWNANGVSIEDPHRPGGVQSRGQVRPAGATGASRQMSASRRSATDEMG